MRRVRITGVADQDSSDAAAWLLVEARLAVAHRLAFAHAWRARRAFAVSASGFRGRQLGGVVGVAQPRAFYYTGSAMAADAGVALDSEDALGEFTASASSPK